MSRIWSSTIYWVKPHLKCICQNGLGDKNITWIDNRGWYLDFHQPVTLLSFTFPLCFYFFCLYSCFSIFLSLSLYLISLHSPSSFSIHLCPSIPPLFLYPYPWYSREGFFFWHIDKKRRMQNLYVTPLSLPYSTTLKDYG